MGLARLPLLKQMRGGCAGLLQAATSWLPPKPAALRPHSKLQLAAGRSARRYVALGCKHQLAPFDKPASPQVVLFISVRRYVALGWAALPFLQRYRAVLPNADVALIVAGGIVYSLGVSRGCCGLFGTACWCSLLAQCFVAACLCSLLAHASARALAQLRGKCWLLLPPTLVSCRRSCTRPSAPTRCPMCMATTRQAADTALMMLAYSLVVVL